MSLSTTKSTLMHSALALVSPPLREFDLLAFGPLRKRPSPRPLSLSSTPTEILFHIRAQLLPALITRFISASATSLQRYETSLRYLMCPQCTFYNEYVYGPDVWKWHPCSCVPGRPNIDLRKFRDQNDWLETYLSRKSLRFRGLSPQHSTSSAAIWDIVTDVLEDFGCDAVQKNLGSSHGTRSALFSRRDCQPIILVPRSTGEPRSDYTWMANISLRRLERNLGLSWDYTEPFQRSPAHLAHPTRRSCLAPNSPAFTSTSDSEFTVIAALVDALTTPLTIFLTALASFAALFFTVLCYYSRPRALRVL